MVQSALVENTDRKRNKDIILIYQRWQNEEGKPQFNTMHLVVTIWIDSPHSASEICTTVKKPGIHTHICMYIYIDMYIYIQILAFYWQIISRVWVCPNEWDILSDSVYALSAFRKQELVHPFCVCIFSFICGDVSDETAFCGRVTCLRWFCPDVKHREYITWPMNRIEGWTVYFKVLIWCIFSKKIFEWTRVHFVMQIHTLLYFLHDIITP